MKIIVISDSHGHNDLLEDVILENPDASLFIFLGDGIRGFESVTERYPEKEFWSVSGNCDWNSSRPSTDSAWVRGFHILYTHGHTWGVRAGLDELKAHARQTGARIVLFGHTHIPYSEEADGIHYMNPGSISLPRDGFQRSYGIIELDGKQIHLRHIFLKSPAQ